MPEIQKTNTEKQTKIAPEEVRKEVVDNDRLPIYLQDMAEKFPQKRESFQRMDKAISDAEKLKEKGIDISHRLIMKGEELIQFLEKGEIPKYMATIDKTVATIERVMKQYIAPGKTAFDPPIKVLLTWADPAGFVEKIDMQVFACSQSDEFIHGLMNRYAFERANKLSDTLKIEDKKYAEKLKPIAKAVELAKAELGGSISWVPEEVLSAMTQLQTQSFDGATDMISTKSAYTKKQGYTVKGVLSTTNSYAGFEYSVLHSCELANQLLQKSDYVLEETIQEARLDPFDSDPTRTLVFQMSVNLRRTQEAFGHIPLSIQCSGKNIALVDIHKEFEKIPPTERKTGHYLRALEYAIYGKYITPIPEKKPDPQENLAQTKIAEEPKVSREPVIQATEEAKKETPSIPVTPQVREEKKEESPSPSALSQETREETIQIPTQEKVVAPDPVVIEEKQTAITQEEPTQETHQTTTDVSPQPEKKTIQADSTNTPAEDSATVTKNLELKINGERSTISNVSRTPEDRTTSAEQRKSEMTEQVRSETKTPPVMETPTQVIPSAPQQAPRPFQKVASTIPTAALRQSVSVQTPAPSVVTSKQIVERVNKENLPSVQSAREAMRVRAVETSTKNGGELLSYTPADRKKFTERIDQYQGKEKGQELNSILPSEIWTRVAQQKTEHVKHIEELQKTILAINKKYGITINITYLTDLKILERKVKNGEELKKGVELKVLGSIEELTKTAGKIQEALAFYEPNNPFDGHSFEILWFDSFGSKTLGLASREKVTLKTGVDISIIHHELGHILDYQEGNHWEKKWHECAYDRAISFKRYINYLVKDELGAPSIGSNKEVDEEMREKRKVWFQMLDQKQAKSFAYTFAGEKKVVDVLEFMNEDGSFKGTPSEYALTDGAEERAELWRTFTEKGLSMGGNTDLQNRIKEMGSVLTEQNIVSVQWFEGK